MLMVVACRVKSDVCASITNVSEYSSGHAHICHSVGLGLTVHVAIHIIIIIIIIIKQQFVRYCIISVDITRVPIVLLLIYWCTC